MFYLCCWMLVVIIPKEVSSWDETRRKKNTKSYHSKKPSFVLLTSLRSKRLKIILVHFRNVKEEFEVTVICTGQNVKLNSFRFWLKNISISNRLDNGQEEKMIPFKPLFRMARNLPVALNTDTRSIAFRYFDLFTESTLFLTSYFVVSKWWLVLKWNNFFFCSAPAGQRGWSCYL